ncbi:MAG: DUF4405 domain-containing protein [Oscillospiraceae bacterium]|nr:DUF4405 domain-containing protein [Oscillospiraceae bacterium]
MDRSVGIAFLQKGKRNSLRLIVDALLLLLLLCLMSCQVTGEALHEWGGVAMTLTVIVRQILNRRWYAAIFKGKHNACRALTTLVNVLLFAAMLATAFCGMAMSGYAVPFLYWPGGVSLVRPGHLAMSHWAFLLMGLHLGLHLPVMAGKRKPGERTKAALSVFGAVLGGVGRFGQSLTAIAKLAPGADIGEGLSVHYSGGSSLSADVSAWLERNGIR